MKLVQKVSDGRIPLPPMRGDFFLLALVLCLVATGILLVAVALS